MRARRDQAIEGVVYRIHCRPNGRFYIGSSMAVGRRWYRHKLDLAAGRHHSPKLQAAWNKYGAEAFEFSIVERATGLAALLMAEQRHIDAAGEQALNCAKRAGSPFGVVRTSSQRAAISAAKLAFYKTDAGRSAIEARRAKVVGRVQSPEERARRSAALKGRGCGRIWTAEQRAAHALALTGRKMPPVSEETRARISAAKKGKSRSPAAVAASVQARIAWIEHEVSDWLVMRKEGLSYREIERRTGRCRQVVARECTKRGA